MTRVFNSNFSKSDIFYTPDWAIDLLLEYADMHEYSVYEPACGEGHIVRRLERLGVHCTGNDIRDGHDFLTVDNNQIRAKYDAIITNPPFSIKDAFIEKCIEIGLPWALLLPVASIQGKKRNSLLCKVSDLSIIIPNKRVSYIGQDVKSAPNFASAWFCSDFGMSKQLIFQK